MKDSEHDCLLRAMESYFEATYSSHYSAATVQSLFRNALAMHSSLVDETEPSGWF